MRRGGLAVALALFLAFAALAYAREPVSGDGAGDVVIPALPRSPAEPSQPAIPQTGTQGTPFVFSDPNGVSWHAPVRRKVTAHARPSLRSKVVGRLSTRTPEGTTNIVLALARVERNGQLWIRARLPVLPNNTLGWIPRTALGGYGKVSTHLVVDLSSFRATLYRKGRKVWSARVGVGQSRWATPTGRFYIRNRLTKYSSPTYGPLAFGTSARSPVLTDWPAGGFVGIHGTNAPGLIPGRISHGCIRLHNDDIRRLDRLMAPGSPLTITT